MELMDSDTIYFIHDSVPINYYMTLSAPTVSCVIF